MISKRSPPPRPPMPKRNLDSSTKLSGQVDNQETGPLKKVDFFTIRYSRDDANESDEEISIVRKEDNANGEDAESKGKPQSPDVFRENTSNENNGNATNSLLSTISRPFLHKSPTKNSSEASNTQEKPVLDMDKDEEHVPDQDLKSTETVLGDSSVNELAQTREPKVSHGRRSVSPPKQRNEKSTDPVVSSAMSLSSLLKKEMEHKAHFAKVNTDAKLKSERNGQLEEDSTKKGSLSSALMRSSRLLVPFGMSYGASTRKEDSKGETLYTDVPLYNILLASVAMFLFLMMPTSSFMNGFVLGGFLMFFTICTLMWLLTPEMSDEERYRRDLLEHAKELEGMVRNEPESLEAELWHLFKPRDLEGWFFKASSYNPTKPVDFSDPDQVKPVYACVSGHTLSLYTPRDDEVSKIKRSIMLEANVSIKYSASKDYDLGHGGEIELVPHTLHMKRIWVKKYPIYLKVFEKPLSSKEENDEDVHETFELPSVTEEMYLFCPTGRGKEEWFYRIEKLLKPRIQKHLMTDLEGIFNPHTSFPHYMARLIGAASEPSSPAQLTWVNALLGRIFWDVWNSEYWNNKVKNRIQSKISKIKLPSFIRYLKVADMRLGNALPTIQRAHNLHEDDRGIWVDLDVDYEGGIMLTLETMVNLEYYLRQLTEQGKGDGEEVVLKFSRDESGYSDVSSSESDEGEVDEDLNDGSRVVPTRSQLSPASLSSEDSTAGDNGDSDTEVEGTRRSVGSVSQSEPDPDQENQGWAGKVKNPKGKKILNMLEKVAKSKWVQMAAETKVVQRAVEKFSNLPIILGVEVATLHGTVAANIPPPPSNRIWLGFRSNPLISLIARPKLGEHHVRLTHVTEWIEYKLKQEFKSMFVLPNMEDLTVRIMDSGLEDKFPGS